MAQRIKKGDRVFVNSGKDSGKTGEVMKIQGLKAIVKDVNVSKKHQKQDQNSQGGIVNKEMPIAIDNLMPLNKKSGLVPWDSQVGDNNYIQEPWILKKERSTLPLKKILVIEEISIFKKMTKNVFL